MSADGASPPPGVTADLFKAWRSPRYGKANPERMDNPLWEWLIGCRLDAYRANQALHGPSSIDAGPMWCFDRFGQSTTPLGDVTVLIGGEHEDHYDPDFQIYNDLVVITPGGGTEIYGYPRSEFPPTDFHSATPTDRSIVLIGSLGYLQERRVGETQVLIVERPGWRASLVECIGDPPGWIHGHRAELHEGSSIVVTGGKLFRGRELSLVESIDDWKLHLNGWRWERLTQRRWPRFEAYRNDRRPNHLFELRTVLWERQMKWASWEARARDLESKLGGPPRLDLVASLYQPSVPHEAVPEQEDEYAIHRIRVDGVVVRYVEDGWTVQVTVEGELATDVVERLRHDLSRTLEALERAPIESRDIA